METNKLNLILILIVSLLSGNGLAVEKCIQDASTDNSEIIPPLRQALGEEAFNDAINSKKYSYMGNAKCRLCHRDFFIGRKKDVHDHAYENLVASNPEHADNPRCLSCHTTGYGVRTGFRNMKRSAKLANVQCEGCHGPGRVHIQRQVAKMPADGISSIDKNSTEKAGGFLAGTDKPEILKRMCKSCHTDRWNHNAKDFDKEYNSYKTAKPENIN